MIMDNVNIDLLLGATLYPFHTYRVIPNAYGTLVFDLRVGLYVGLTHGKERKERD
jgi:hypothetical protein